MTVTRAEVEAVLVRRAGKLLATADLGGATINGANPDLNDPIGWAVRKLGHTVTDLLAVADADLADVSADEVDQLLDYAELRTLETIATSLDDVDITVGPRSEKLNQLAAQVEKAIARKRAQIAEDYGAGQVVEAGVISLGFMQRNPEDA